METRNQHFNSISNGQAAIGTHYAHYADTAGAPPRTHFMTQRQDHFDRQNTNLWQQRYLVPPLAQDETVILLTLSLHHY